jgi:type IV pilus assembly protein PilB
LIVKEATADEIEEQAKKEGMIAMVEDGFVKAAQGITTIEEVLRVIIE